VTAEQTEPPDVEIIEARVKRLDDVECCFHANGVARLLRKHRFAWKRRSSRISRFRRKALCMDCGYAAWPL
jgi:hypothetical protein